MSSSSNGDGDALCPSVWKNLPDELVERVLRGVPFSSLIQFRQVCKKWNSLILSAEFIRMCQKQESPKFVPVLVPLYYVDLVEKAGWAINRYDAVLNSWQEHSLSFLQTASVQGPLYVTASSGGLMCLETTDRHNFIICNPVTKRWRHLQLPSSDQVIAKVWSSHSADYRQLVAGLVVCRETGNYKLLIASLADSSERSTFIYDSSTSLWRRGAQVPPGKRFVNPSALTCNGNLYCLVKNGRGLEERSCIWRLLKYEVEHDNWTEVPVETGWWPENATTELELVEHRGQVLLVARVLSKRWLPNNSFYRLWYNTFYKVCESPASPDMTLVQERRLFQPLDKSIESTGFMTIVTSSFAGQGDLIYTTGIPFFSNDDVGVLKILVMNTTIQNYNFLPDVRRGDFKNEVQMEIRLLEPSLTAAA